MGIFTRRRTGDKDVYELVQEAVKSEGMFPGDTPPTMYTRKGASLAYYDMARVETYEFGWRERPAGVSSEANGFKIEKHRMRCVIPSEIDELCRLSSRYDGALESMRLGATKEEYIEMVELHDMTEELFVSTAKSIFDTRLRMGSYAMDNAAREKDGSVDPEEVAARNKEIAARFTEIAENLEKINQIVVSRRAKLDEVIQRTDREKAADVLDELELVEEKELDNRARAAALAETLTAPTLGGGRGGVSM